eukprot:SAG11_NODE_4455_length_1889_cov_1.665922_1_plen_191_part_00
MHVEYHVHVISPSGTIIRVTRCPRDFLLPSAVEQQAVRFDMKQRQAVVGLGTAQYQVCARPGEAQQQQVAVRPGGASQVKSSDVSKLISTRNTLLCEKCGIKTRNYGFESDGRRRWCGGCAKTVPNSVNINLMKKDARVKSSHQERHHTTGQRALGSDIVPLLITFSKKKTAVRLSQQKLDAAKISFLLA